MLLIQHNISYLKVFKDHNFEIDISTHKHFDWHGNICYSFLAYRIHILVYLQMLFFNVSTSSYCINTVLRLNHNTKQ